MPRTRGRRPYTGRLLLLSAMLTAWPALAAVEASDDTGQSIRLSAPARRIVSLAPHATELLYAAGAGDRLVAVGTYSDHPPAARALPQVGSHDTVDLERLLALEPDLVVAWQSGNDPRLIDRLQALGLTVFVSEPRSLEDIPRTLVRLGELAGTAAVAQPAADAFRARHRQLAARYRGARPVRVFYQIWDRPLQTVNGAQIISQVLALCGGRNVFAGLEALAPQVSVEAVLAADPEAIVASGDHDAPPAWLADWRRWPQLTAVQRNNLFAVPPDLIQRHSPRILDGAEILCEQLQRARQKAR